MSLYLPQDDVVMGTLSVRENLDFSAALRLPGHMTRAQRKERVERVIETLGLYQCADTKVSSSNKWRVSLPSQRVWSLSLPCVLLSAC